MFKSKWDKWREQQDPKTLAYLDSQPIWHDKDLYKALALGIIIGIVVGFAWGFDVGAPDLTRIIHTGIKG